MAPLQWPWCVPPDVAEGTGPAGPSGDVTVDAFSIYSASNGSLFVSNNCTGSPSGAPNCATCAATITLKLVALSSPTQAVGLVYLVVGNAIVGEARCFESANTPCTITSPTPVTISPRSAAYVTVEFAGAIQSVKEVDVVTSVSAVTLP